MGDREQATAYWTVSPGHGELRTEPLPEPGPDDVVVRALHSGISRGTELLVHGGRVPSSIAERMRAPFQSGDFPGPVKFGYLSVGVVEHGPDELLGRQVFCLYPHQDRYVVPAASVLPIPDGVPARRAALTGAVETATNALWDAAPRIGDRIAVVGGGMVGGAVAALLQRFPLDRLELVDVDPRRRSVADRLGVRLVEPDHASPECDLVVHVSGTAAGLAKSLELLGDEGEVIEVSWYGDDDVAVPLGAAFHPRRLAIRASQVSEVAASRRARRSHTDRLRLALRLLADDRFDALISGSSPFAELPDTMQRLASGELEALCHVIDYEP
jgi:threonine dehydrogenase-like Zn-dependent dehydrogenase